MAMIAAVAALALGGVQPQVMPVTALDAPFPSYGEYSSITVDFWCRYDLSSVPECEGQARDGFVLPPNAGDWLERKAGTRPDYINTGLERRISLTFTAGVPGFSPVQDAEKRWRFWWPELQNPNWTIPLSSLPKHLFYWPVSSPRRSAMKGEIFLSCGVRADGYLDLCILDRPLEDGEGPVNMANQAKAIAANLRVEQTQNGGGSTAGHYVRISVAFDGAQDLTDEPSVVSPQVISRPSSDAMLAMYPQVAAERAVAGRAVMECVSPADTGPLENCVVISETPGGHGFGSASVAATEMMVTAPMVMEGHTYRQLVRQRIQWEMF